MNLTGVPVSLEHSIAKDLGKNMGSQKRGSDTGAVTDATYQSNSYDEYNRQFDDKMRSMKYKTIDNQHMKFSNGSQLQ